MKFVFGGLKLLFVKYAVLTQKCVNRTTDFHKKKSGDEDIDCYSFSAVSNY